MDGGINVDKRLIEVIIIGDERLAGEEIQLEVRELL